MRTARRLCCSQKRLLCILSGHVLVICALLTHHKFYGHTHVTNIYSTMSTSENSLKSVHQTRFGYPSSFTVSRSSEETNMSVATKLICYIHQGNVNWTLCPECLRPAVKQLNNSFYEIEQEENVNSNKSTDYFKARQERVERLVTEYLIVPRFNSSNYYLLAIQPSILDRKYERDVVRNTWASVVREQKWPYRKINANVKVVFVVSSQILAREGQNITNVSRDQAIQSEAVQNNDILYIDMIDSYQNLTLKLLSAFKWVKDNCPCVKFVLKVDFDTFVNIPLLVDTLLYFENRFEYSILGRIYKSTEVKREGRWAVPVSLYPMDTYISYASGCGYVMSYKVLSQIVNTAPYVPMFSMEDAFITGVMRRIIGCRMFSFPGLFTNFNERHWYRCLMLQDQKILGTSNDGGSRHRWVWDSITKGQCK